MNNQTIETILLIGTYAAIVTTFMYLVTTKRPTNKQSKNTF